MFRHPVPDNITLGNVPQFTGAKRSGTPDYGQLVPEPPIEVVALRWVVHEYFRCEVHLSGGESRVVIDAGHLQYITLNGIYTTLLEVMKHTLTLPQTLRLMVKLFRAEKGFIPYVKMDFWTERY